MMRKIILTTALLLAGCNPVANLHQGDAQIERFHQAYSSGNVDALYALTGPKFHQITTRKQFQDLFDLVNFRLGAIKSSKRQGFTVNSTTDGIVTNVAMDTQFAQGEATEAFYFEGSGDDMKLEGWHVNSDKLMVTPEDIARERSEVRPIPPAAN
jgi:hypothetical protein